MKLKKIFFALIEHLLNLPMADRVRPVKLLAMGHTFFKW